MSAADEVLAALTDDEREQVVRSFATTFRGDITLDAQGWRAGPLSGRWSVTPAEAVEVLATRGLWPWAPGDDAAPRWWCERCQGSGLDPRVRLYRKPCAERCDWGTAADPPTLAALVAVASLGVDALRRAEGLALQLVGRSPRVVFRAVSRETLRAWTEERVYRDGDASLAYVAAHEALGAPSTSPLHYGHGETWSESFPWLGLSGGHVARRHWSVVRDLGLLGAMLVDLSGDRVTLAVESL